MVLALSQFDCGGRVATSTCTPGARSSCECAGGAAGTQVCNDTGSGCEPCSCPDAGSGVPPPSCAGGGPGLDNCGPNGNESCCESLLVAGVATASFYRSYDGVSGTACYYADCDSKAYPAQVSDFRLDKFEITVGRFRKYIAAVEAGWMPSAGAGKHVHLNCGLGLSDGRGGYETGWDPRWNTPTNFPTDSATWDSKLTPRGIHGETWSAGDDNLPIDYISWYDAVAFCIWDGGFLPSEAEWNFAASGGTEQRSYPWGSTPPGADAKLAVYGCYYHGTGPASCSGANNMAPVGSIPAGNGKYGQSDLAGNVWEWNLDWVNATYPMSCANCANLVPSEYRVTRGGAFFNDAAQLLAGGRNYDVPDEPGVDGARCARLPY